MRNEYVRIDPHSNRELTSHYLQYALYSFLLTMKKVFMLSLFYTQCEASMTKSSETCHLGNTLQHMNKLLFCVV